MDAAVSQTEKPQGTGTPDIWQFLVDHHTIQACKKNTKKCVNLAKRGHSLTFYLFILFHASIFFTRLSIFVIRLSMLNVSQTSHRWTDG